MEELTEGGEGSDCESEGDEEMEEGSGGEEEGDDDSDDDDEDDDDDEYDEEKNEGEETKEKAFFSVHHLYGNEDVESQSRVVLQLPACFSPILQQLQKVFSLFFLYLFFFPLLPLPSLLPLFFPTSFPSDPTYHSSIDKRRTFVVLI